MEVLNFNTDFGFKFEWNVNLKKDQYSEYKKIYISKETKFDKDILLKKIINDSSLLSNLDDENIINDINELFLLQNIDINLLFKLYFSDYNFNNTELIKIIKYLSYLDSTKLNEILLYIKLYHTNININTFNDNIIREYNNIDISDVEVSSMIDKLGEKIDNKLKVVIKYGYFNLFMWILQDTNYSLNKDFISLMLDVSIKYNHLPIIKKLLNILIEISIFKEIKNEILYEKCCICIIYGHIYTFKYIISILHDKDAKIYTLALLRYKKFMIDNCVFHNRLEILKMLVENMKYELLDKDTLLKVSVHNFSFDVAYYLINLGANIRTFGLYSPHIREIKNIDSDKIISAIQFFANYNIVDDIKIIFIKSCRYGYIDVVKYILENKIYVSQYILNYQLLERVMSKNLYLLKLLLDHGVDVNNREGITSDRNILYFAIYHANYDIVKLLLDRGVDIQADNNSSLIASIYVGNCNIVKLLLEKGADIHTRKDYVLRLACRKEKYDIVKLLLDNGADVRANNDEALIDSVYSGYYDIVNLLIERGADINTREGQAFKIAMNQKRYDIVHLLLLKKSFGKQQLKIEDYI